MYLDADNLYGWAMSQCLPNDKFKWCTEIEIRKINLAKHTEGSEKGLILEVDLEYPDELHEIDDDYPLAAEKIDVTKDMLSNYCEEIRHKYNISTAHVKKLVPLLNEKEKYVLI